MGDLFVNNNLLIKTKKYFVNITGIFLIVCSLLLTSCAFNKKLSDEELKEYSDQLEESLKTFCDSYNLSDVEIDMNDNYYKGYKNHIYVITAEIKSDEFLKLSGIDAFNLIRESESLKITPQNSSNIISLSITMMSGDRPYKYESHGNIEYLMSAGTSVVTLKSGEIVLDEFKNEDWFED